MPNALRFARFTPPLLGVCLIAGLAVGQEPIELKRNAPPAGEQLAVTVDMKIGGKISSEIREAGGPAAAPDSPVAIEAQIAYRQAMLAGHDDTALRRYTSVEVSRSGAAVPLPLRDDRRLVVVRASEGAPRAAALGGSLRRSEADLLQLAADPLIIDRLLPQEPVAEGDSWPIDASLAGPLLGLESVSLADVTAVLDGATEGHARFRLAGTVHGAIDGAETEIDLQGVALFDRKAGRVAKLNLAVEERRKIGPATPALEANMKLNLTVGPAEGGEPIAANDLRRAGAAAGDEGRLEERLLVEVNDWAMLAPRDWFLVNQKKGASTLRRVVDGRVAAFATLRVLPGGKPTTPEALQREVRYGMKGRVARVLATDQWTTPGGLRCVAVATEGREEDGAAAEWRHYHATIAKPRAEAVALAVTLPVGEQGALDPDGRAMVDSLRKAAGPRRSTAARDDAPAKR